MNQQYGTTICWLRVTNYMRGWLRYALGGRLTVKSETVLSVRHLEGIRRVMMMETAEDVGCKPGSAISGAWHDALVAGLEFDRWTMESEYGVTGETLRDYVPIECPCNAVSADGVIRPWTSDTCFGKQQSTELLRLLRGEFWGAVWEFSAMYAEEHKGEKYAQVEMIEAFCRETGTDDVYVEAIRREWQRRVKRMKN